MLNVLTIIKFLNVFKKIKSHYHKWVSLHSITTDIKIDEK